MTTMTRTRRPMSRPAGHLFMQLQAMREGKTRMQEQHAHVGAAITNAITHRMSACMPPKHLAALVPREEETHFSGDAFDTQRRGEKSSSRPAAGAKWASKTSPVHFNGRCQRGDSSPLQPQIVSSMVVVTHLDYSMWMKLLANDSFLLLYTSEPP